MSSLPSWAIDLIHDGVPEAELRAFGDMAVWSALVRTAMSANARGWSYGQWDTLVTTSTRKISHQVRQRRGKPLTRAEQSKWLADAWECGARRLAEGGPTWNRDEVRLHAENRAALVLALVDDLNVDLSQDERVVLAYAARETQERGLLRVPMPWRAVMAATGLTERRTKRALSRLQERGLTQLVSHGDWRETKRKANLYSLPPEDALVFAPYMAGFPGLRDPGDRPKGPSLVSPGLSRRIPKGPSKVNETGDPMLILSKTPDGRFILQTPVDGDILDRLISALSQDGREVRVETVENLPDNVRRMPGQQ